MNMTPGQNQQYNNNNNGTAGFGRQGYYQPVSSILLSYRPASFQNHGGGPGGNRGLMGGYSNGNGERRHGGGGGGGLRDGTPLQDGVPLSAVGDSFVSRVSQMVLPSTLYISRGNSFFFVFV